MWPFKDAAALDLSDLRKEIKKTIHFAEHELRLGHKIYEQREISPAGHTDFWKKTNLRLVSDLRKILDNYEKRLK